MLYAYTVTKKEGSSGQQEKAVCMLQSRKIVLGKCFIDAGKREIFIKTMIKK